MVKVVHCSLPNLADYCDNGLADGIDYTEFGQSNYGLPRQRKKGEKNKQEPTKKFEAATPINFGEEI